jgi:hypothetical protein
MSEKKPKATKLDLFLMAVYSWGWIGSWFTAIWMREYSWQLFFTGSMLLFMGFVAASVRDYSKE